MVKCITARAKFIAQSGSKIQRHYERHLCFFTHFARDKCLLGHPSWSSHTMQHLYMDSSCLVQILLVETIYVLLKFNHNILLSHQIIVLLCVTVIFPQICLKYIVPSHKYRQQLCGTQGTVGSYFVSFLHNAKGDQKASYILFPPERKLSCRSREEMISLLGTNESQKMTFFVV